MARFDADGNGFITYDEFARHLLQQQTGIAGVRPVSPITSKPASAVHVLLQRVHQAVHPQYDQLVRVFRELDTNRSGSLRPTELKRGLIRMGVRLTDREARVRSLPTLPRWHVTMPLSVCVLLLSVVAAGADSRVRYQRRRPGVVQ